MSKWKITSSYFCRLFKRLVTHSREQSTVLSCCDQKQQENSTIKDKPKINFPMSQQIPSPATVVEIYPLSPLIKGLKLKVHGRDFSFKAGQWIDFYVPEIAGVAGYSICSSPKYFQDTGLIELAVKKSSHPPTKWVCEQCQVGSKVSVAIGGTFHYSSEPSEICQPLLLVAGGVGINPLLSIVRYIDDIKDDLQIRPGRVLLLYSARSLQELIFKDEICNIVANNPQFTAEFYVREHQGTPLTKYRNCRVTTHTDINRRILSMHLQSFFSNIANTKCYLCGPHGMIDSIDLMLKQLGLTADQIKYEKWW